MNQISLPLSIIVAHTVGDWFCQSDWMALNKSKSNKALTAHTLVYSLFLLPWGLTFWALNFNLHWLVDYVTSRITSKLWFFRPYGESNMWFYVDGKRHWFFSMIGLDQLIHFTILALTYKWVFGG